MAWTAPRTWTSMEVVTASIMNSHVRDNLLETSPAKATTAGQIFVAAGGNSIVAVRPDSDFISTSETTTSTSYTDLATTGPTVTITTQVRALLLLSGRIRNSTAGAISLMSFEVGGVSALAPADNRALFYQSSLADDEIQASWSSLVDLTAGSNIFTAKYRVSAGTGRFINRRLSVIPF